MAPGKPRPAQTFAAQDGFYIGRHWAAANQQHDGLIDEVAIYNRALTVAEVETHFAASGRTASNTLPGVLPPPTFSNEIVDNGDPEGFSRTGAWSVGGTGLNGSYSYGGETATWTPSAMQGFAPGQYVVQANWGICVSHASAAQYAVNHLLGTTAVTVDQRKVSAQSAAPGGSPAGVPERACGSPGGWYTLGTFTLDDTSNVTLSGNASGILSADAVRFSKVLGGDGVIIDELSDKASYSGSPWGGTAGSGVPGRASTAATVGLEYQHTGGNSPDAKVVYTPGITGVAELSLSWGVYPAVHSPAAQYVIDLDGNPVTTTDQSTHIVNQRMLADQVTLGDPAGGLWSGWYSTGTHALTAATTITLTDVDRGATDGNYFLTADALLVTTRIPEPSTAILVVVGILAILGCGWRQKASARRVAS